MVDSDGPGSSGADEPGDPVVFDPLADLFFSVVAIVVLAVIVILPSVRLMAETPKAPAADPVVTLDGAKTDPMRATAAGVSYGPAHTMVGLDRIGDDAGLVAALNEAKSRGALLLLIEPDGDEAAFQLEPMIARAGPPQITQVRLDAACGHLRRPMAAGEPCPLLVPAASP